MRRSVGAAGLVVMAGACLAVVSALVGPARLTELRLGDVPYLLLLVAHLGWGAALVVSPKGLAKAISNRGAAGGRAVTRFPLAPELLISASLLLFLFAYFFALNANMDYVQRFIESGGNLRMALDTTAERGIAALRYLPLLLPGLLVYGWMRVCPAATVRCALRGARQRPEAGKGVSGKRGGGIGGARGTGRLGRRLADGLEIWALPLVLAGSLLSAAAFPSFLRLQGVPLLGWISLVPLFLVLARVSPWRGVFYGVVYGVFTTLLSNYWLSTYSLVSLQVAVVLFFGFYLLFMVPAAFLYRLAPTGRFLVFPLLWTTFELARSSGFLGYPWVLLGHSQYPVLSLIQVAALTGVWGVSFLVLLVNSAAAESILRLLRGRPRAWLPVSVGALVMALVMLGGITVLGAGEARRAEGARGAGEGLRTVRLALVQQNSDPRKHDYEQTFATLRRLTDEALLENPDMVVWSETAFVPNIRRWSQEDPRRYALARLVGQFLEYQRSIATWLLTGNDDYTVVYDQAGQETDRLNYNAAVLFSDAGERVETYHKIRLVPFTEHFPYQRQLPWVYQLLLDFDVYFWQEGSQRTVFRHPKFRFSTPICFEDVFPDEVRRFVLAGAEIIVNISNDYWSLTEVQAKQHFAGGMFRAVENRRPLVRSTASGLTAHVDEYGRVLGSLPYYAEAQMVAEVTVPPRVTTFYTRFGDWFPLATLLAALALAGVNLALRLLPRRRRRKVPVL